MKATNLNRAFRKSNNLNNNLNRAFRKLISQQSLHESTNFYRAFRKLNGLNRAFRKSAAVSCAWVFAATDLISRFKQVHL